MKRLIPVFLASALLLAGCGVLAPAASPTPAPAASTPFVFTAENYPALAGGASMLPLASGAASVLLGAGSDAVTAQESFGSTGASYRALQNGSAALILAAQAPEALAQELADAGFEYESAPVCTDALVFYVSADNPVDSLTAAQLRDIYSGAVTNWSQVGGADEPVAAFQRGEDDASRAALESLVMDGTAVSGAPEARILGADGTAESVQAVFDGGAGAIGYGLYASASALKLSDGLKLLQVDGTAPSADAIRSGAYPFPVTFCAVIASSAAEGSPERVLWAWLQGAEGQKLTAQCGYVSVS